MKKSALPRSAPEIDQVIVYNRSPDLPLRLAECSFAEEFEIRKSRLAKEFEQAAKLSPRQPSPESLWDEAVDSLGRSARVLEELAESTGATIARVAARGDRIDRIQKDRHALLSALVASEADA
jgi:hypothetical protein